MRFTSDRGFTLIELMAVMAVIAIVAGMTALSVQAALVTARGDAAMTQVSSLLRAGRDAAIAQRRVVTLVITAPNRIQLVRSEISSGTTTIADVVLESGAQFQFVGTLPDTPDGFGNSTPVSFGAATTLRFLPDGTFTDGTSVPINGTIFTATNGQALTSRAVTITGASGRPQRYRWTGSRWEAQ